MNLFHFFIFGTVGVAIDGNGKCGGKYCEVRVETQQLVTLIRVPASVAASDIFAPIKRAPHGNSRTVPLHIFSAACDVYSVQADLV